MVETMAEAFEVTFRRQEMQQKRSKEVSIQYSNDTILPDSTSGNVSCMNIVTKATYSYSRSAWFKSAGVKVTTVLIR